MKKSFLLFFLFFSINMLLSAQKLSTVIDVSQDSKILRRLSTKYKSSLFNASDTSFVKTIQNWQQVLVALEKHSEETKFDLKGIKLEIKVFWSKHGKIDYITYYILQESINIDYVSFQAFLRSFIRIYELPVHYKKRFSYAGKAIFPLYLMN